MHLLLVIFPRPSLNKLAPRKTRLTLLRWWNTFMAIMTFGPKLEVLPTQLGQIWAFAETIRELGVGWKMSLWLEGCWGWPCRLLISLCITSSSCCQLDIISWKPLRRSSRWRTCLKVRMRTKRAHNYSWSSTSPAGMVLTAVASSEMRANACKYECPMER